MTSGQKIKLFELHFEVNDKDARFGNVPVMEIIRLAKIGATVEDFFHPLKIGNPI